VTMAKLRQNGLRRTRCLGMKSVLLRIANGLASNSSFPSIAASDRGGTVPRSISRCRCFPITYLSACCRKTRARSGAGRAAGPTWADAMCGAPKRARTVVNYRRNCFLKKEFLFIVPLAVRCRGCGYAQGPSSFHVHCLEKRQQTGTGACSASHRNG
jgi:hypothetical protein